MSFHIIFTYTGREQYWTFCLSRNVVLVVVAVIVVIFSVAADVCNRIIALLFGVRIETVAIVE